MTKYIVYISQGLAGEIDYEYEVYAYSKDQANQIAALKYLESCGYKFEACINQ